MRTLIINSVYGVESTGRICTELGHELKLEGYQVKIAYGCKELLSEKWENMQFASD